ncbi:MAG: hypothetical protein QGG67_06810, partial [Gammaproteobacteria bacterium]|nr:hypothetical protein [Gammaproteobacteria bacterium]
PRGNYLANEHTSKYCRRESWNARYFGAQYPTASSVLPDKDLLERIDQDLQQILKNHWPKKLPGETINTMRKIAQDFRYRVDG